jgi:signal transduction histidine kinase
MARAGVGTNYLEVCGEAAVAGEAGARETATALDAVLARRSDMMEAEYGEKRPGRERWYRLSVMGLRGARGGAVIARTDITDQVEARERFRQFSHHLLSAQEEERRRIARELHDDLNQRMVLLALDVSRLAQALPDGKGLESAQQIGARVGEIAEDLHALAYKLHPFRLEYLGLAGAARGLCSEIAAAHDLAVSFVDRDVPSSLSREAALCAYRVLQEALSNVVKHSGSSRAEVSLVGDGAELRLSVRDFGVGMSPEAARSTSGLGFSSIQERLRAVNGRFALDTSGPVGIELRAAIPLSAASIA